MRRKSGRTEPPILSEEPCAICGTNHGWRDHVYYASALPYAIPLVAFAAWLMLLIGIGRGWW